MLSKFFNMKIKSEQFNNELLNLVAELKDKKVIVYGAGEGFKFLNKKHDLINKLNIVAIADKKFENEETKKQGFSNLKTIAPDEIPAQDYDYILVSNEASRSIVGFLKNNLEVMDEKIKTIFVEEIADESKNYNYLADYNFGKHLKRLNRILKNKSIILYGAGSYLEVIKKYYNLDGLNILGISDKRFAEHGENEEFLGYKVYSLDEIKEINPNYVLVATKFFVSIIDDLADNVLKDTKIKVKPLARKPFMVLLKEIWG